MVNRHPKRIKARQFTRGHQRQLRITSLLSCVFNKHFENRQIADLRRKQGWCPFSQMVSFDTITAIGIRPAIHQCLDNFPVIRRGTDEVIKDIFKYLAVPVRRIHRITQVFPSSGKIHIKHGAFLGVINVSGRLARKKTILLSWIITMQTTMEHGHRIAQGRRQIITSGLDIGPKFNQSGNR